MNHPLTGLIGVALLFFIAWLASNNRRAIRPRVVLACFALQVGIAVLVLYTGFGKAGLQAAAGGMETLLSYSDAGISFMFGPLGDPGGPAGFVFFTRVLPVIIFFAALMEVLYHLKVMPFIVRWGGRFIRVVTGTRPIESLNVVANIFVGQVEAPISLKPYLGRISKYELFTIMVSGLASIAGSVMAGYIALGISADYLIAAAFMSAPAGLMMAKIIMPEPPELAATVSDEPVMAEPEGGREYSNVFLAAANGAQSGVQIAIAVAAMLIAFTSLIALVNGLLGWVGGFFGMDALSIQSILGTLFSPLMWSVGVPWEEARAAGGIFGEKVVLNEFIAYLSLSAQMGEFSARTQTILTFALCGFANFASIGILLGGLGTIIPDRKGEIARMGLKAVFAASLANLMSAALAGILVGL